MLRSRYNKTPRITRDIPRGTANVAVLPESFAHATHVTQQSPMDLKRKELADRALTNMDEDQSRVKRTAAERPFVRPL